MAFVRSTNCHIRQYELLVEAVETHELIRIGSKKHSAEVKVLWMNLAKKLNTMGVGPQKSWSDWRRKMRHWYSDVRTRARAIENKDKSMCGKSLTPLEKRLLSAFDESEKYKEPVTESMIKVELLDASAEETTSPSSSQFSELKTVTPDDHNFESEFAESSDTAFSQSPAIPTISRPRSRPIVRPTAEVKLSQACSCTDNTAKQDSNCASRTLGEYIIAELCNLPPGQAAHLRSQIRRAFIDIMDGS